MSAIERGKSAGESVELIFDIPPDTSDLRTSILPLKSKKFDALVVYLLPTSHHGLLEAFKILQKPIPMFGLEEFLVQEHNKGFESTIEGTLVIAPYATEAYTIAFENAYGRSAGFYYTPAFYDFMTLLNDTMKGNQGLRGLELVKAMHFQGAREGVSGRYAVKLSTNGVHSYSFPIGIYRVSKGGLQLDDVISFVSSTRQ